MTCTAINDATLDGLLTVRFNLAGMQARIRTGCMIHTQAYVVPTQYPETPAPSAAQPPYLLFSCSARRSRRATGRTRTSGATIPCRC